ncbi:uncharacterized protein [Chelonus insularis]|uniref:uncharacterized protein isoform X2 n=1 Tax=Chelonus insularis TaxID=460826 RepID=UPI0015890074|nr:uncharacterized protein LOC118065701 isoform X2 [Chelonus insularis]
MINVSSPVNTQKFNRIKRKGVAFLSSLFKPKRLITGMNSNEEEMEKTARVETLVSQSSPSHSILTLTPGRTRNIDQDMEALRLSRQDNPFLQILASRESLIESAEESESDDAILMSQELGDADPLTLAQVHEHLVRSPPPASWPHSPAFPFNSIPMNSDNSCATATRYKSTTSPSKASYCKRSHVADPNALSVSEPSNDNRDRHSHTFSLLNPTPIRTLTEVRRLHRSADDNVQLMSSE